MTQSTQNKPSFYAQISQLVSLAFHIKTRKEWAGRWLGGWKCLLDKCEDLSLNSQNPHQSQTAECTSVSRCFYEEVGSGDRRTPGSLWASYLDRHRGEATQKVTL